MNITNFMDLQSSLSEIYAAVHANQDNSSLPLCAVSLSHLYYTGTWTGQMIYTGQYIYRWIRPQSNPPSVHQALHFILTTLFDHAVHHAYDARHRRIWHHMRKLDHIEKEVLGSDIQIKQCNRYGDHLKEELKNSPEVHNPLYLDDFDHREVNPLGEEEQKALRHRIVNFHHATYPFWSMWMKKQEQLLRHTLMHCINIPASSTLLDRSLFKALKREAKWVQFEGILQQETPVNLLAKIHHPKSLTVPENQRLKIWIEALNQQKHQLSLRLLILVLEEVSKIIALQGSSSVTLEDLIYWLDQEGCPLLHQEDEPHMDWREKLKRGDKIECNGKSLLLGEQISLEKEEDVYKIFALENYPEYVVKIANNRFRLLIENIEAKNEKQHWGFRLVETISNLEEDSNLIVSGLDKSGRCVVLEKLMPAFEEDLWVSTTFQLAKEDEKLALVFANHIFCMIQWKASAQNLSLSHLMWDQEGVLKSTRLLKKGSPNYNEWERYCEQAAQDNAYVLNFLMHVSELNIHPIALYYREAVKHTLKTGKTDLIGRPLPLGYRQDDYGEHIKNLCIQAQQIREICLKKFISHLRKKEAYNYKQKDDLEELVVNHLLKCYQSSSTPGRFAEDFIQKTINNFLNFSEEKTAVDVEEIDSYYQNMHQLMMNYNQSIRTGKLNKE